MSVGNLKLNYVLVPAVESLGIFVVEFILEN
jgi:hypothetical protein